jgi:dTDP-4-dehydrorhamnose reductase
MLKVLVFGASGQLGQCLTKVASDRSLDILRFPDAAHANILDRASLELVFNDVRPSHVINCAAYTAVDKAEDDVEQCRRVNKVGAVNLAQLCKQSGATLIHVSTDFVFEGARPEILKEDDPTEPINMYGLTKLEGERDVVATLSQHYIIRTSWLYSEFANNFVKTMLRLGADRDQLSVIVDQVGTPTYAIDLAAAILTIIESEKEAYGIYHYSNEGLTSWYDFAKSIFTLSKVNIKLSPIPGTQYPTRATRPKFSVLDKTKIKTAFDLDIPHWQDSLARCIEELEKMKTAAGPTC